MKFLVDAQLPRRLARLLTTLDHDAIHTLDLPLGNKTQDDELLEICAREDRVLISKDLECRGLAARKIQNRATNPTSQG